MGLEKQAIIGSLILFQYFMIWWIRMIPVKLWCQFQNLIIIFR